MSGRFLLRRAAHLIAVLFGVMTLLFVLLRVSGDPAASIAGPDATPEAVEAIREQLGLNRPLWAQYLTFLGDLVRFDFGESFQSRQDALGMILKQLPASLELVAVSFLFALLVAIPLGIAAGMTRNRAYQRLVDTVVLFGQAVPVFWFAIVLVFIFAVTLGAVPSIRTPDPLSWVLPVVTLALHPIARLLQFTRAGLAESLREDFTRTARAKGLGRGRVVSRHALRPVATSLVTVAGLDLGQMLSAVVLIETIFAWPGIGQLLVHAVTARDYPLVEATTFIFALIVVVINFVVDLTYERIDPRVRVH
nr:ABC transporter permease [Dactylosporangium thailandense]